MNLKRDTYAIVDLDHLKYNVELAHSEFKRPLMAVIKADAYGHGYKEVASFLKDIDYVEMFAVATLPEAIELRELGIDKGILILGAIPTSKEDIDLAIKYDISLTMVSVDYLKLLDRLIDEGQTLKVHIKLDTGMHRIGLMSKEELSTLLRLVNPDKFNVEGIFTHFATADGDDVVVNKEGKPALKQLIEQYEKTSASVVGVQTVDKKDVSKYGIVEPSKSHPAKGRLVKLTDMVEKPAPEKAPSQLAVLGRYVLTPEIFELLETQGKGAGGEIQLTDAIKRLLDRQAVYAYDFEGKRYDVGDKFGFIKATIDFALDREDLHDQVNSYIHELVKK